MIETTATHRNPSDAEHARVNADCHVYVVLGALVDTVDELPGNVLARRSDDAILVSGVPVVYCEIACTESWERVSEDLPVGDDILQFNACTAQLPSKFAAAHNIKFVQNVVL